MPLTIRETAERIGKSESNVRRLIRIGRLDAEKNEENGAVRIHEESIDRYLNRPERWRPIINPSIADGAA